MNAKTHRRNHQIGSWEALTALTVAFAFSLGALFVTPSYAYADSWTEHNRYTLEKAKGTYYEYFFGSLYHEDDIWNYYGPDFYTDSYGKITNLKVSNKACANVSVWYDDDPFDEPIDDEYYTEDPPQLKIWPKKAGKVTISYKFLGKKHVLKLVFKKYSNPIKNFRIGKKQLRSVFSKCNENADVYLEKYSGKIKITPKKGWKLVSKVRAYYEEQTAFKDIRNGNKVPKGCCVVCFKLKNTKTKETHMFSAGIFETGE